MDTRASQKPHEIKSLKDLLAQKQVTRNPYINHEFQHYGYQLAARLDDLKYKSMYIKLAKTYPRSVLEQAYSFVSDYPKATNKGKLFMWKLKQIRLTPIVVKENINKV